VTTRAFAVTDTSLDKASRLPHHVYAEAVAHCDGGPDTAYAPDEWNVYLSNTKLLCAMFYYRRTETMTVEDRHGNKRTLTPVVNGVAWPYGLALSWDEVDGWTYTSLWDEFSTVGEVWDPLPVPRLAAPAAIRALLPQLLDGNEDNLPRSTQEWKEPRSETLSHLLAVADAERRGIDTRFADDDAGR
jgi:hypothetical protein